MAGGPTPLQRIQRLRDLRVRGTPDLTCRVDAEAVLRDARRAQKSMTGLEKQWGGIVPTSIATATRPGKVWRGTLTIHAADAAAKYVCEKWLGAGGDAVVRGAAKGVRAIKVVL